MRSAQDSPDAPLLGVERCTRKGAWVWWVALLVAALALAGLSAMVQF